jgi:hypothetical protein
MKSKSTALLLLLVLGLGGFYLVHTANQPSRRGYLEQRDRLFPAKEFKHPQAPTNPGLAAIVTNLEIRRNPGDKIILVHDFTGKDPGWSIVEPLRTRADDGAVINLLSELEFLTAVRALQSEEDAPLDLGEYGLAYPQWVLTFGFAGRSWTLIVGDKTADGVRMYAARPDEPDTVYVVPVSLLSLLAADVDAWRHRAALRFDPGKVRRIELAAGGPKILLDRTFDGWRMLEPVREAVDPGVVRRALDAARKLQVAKGDFYSEQPEDLARYGLDAPTFALTLTSEQQRFSLILGSPAGDDPAKRFARRDGPDSPIFALSEEALHPLRVSLDDLRFKTALHFDVAQATALAVTTPEQMTRLEKSSGAWTLRTSSGALADPDMVQLVLSGLANLRIEKWFDKPAPELVAETGLDAPRISVELALDSAPQDLALLIGHEAGDAEWTYARRGDGGPLLLIPSDLPRKLARGYSIFLSRRILDVPQESIFAVALTRPEGETSLTKTADGWTAGDLPPEATDQPAVGDLVWTLSWLEGTDFVADHPSDLTPYGLDAPRIKAVVQFQSANAGPPGKKALLIGAPLDNGGAYAMIEGEERIVAVPRGVVDILAAGFTKPAGTSQKTETQQP